MCMFIFVSYNYLVLCFLLFWGRPDNMYGDPQIKAQRPWIYREMYREFYRKYYRVFYKGFYIGMYRAVRDFIKEFIELYGDFELQGIL